MSKRYELPEFPADLAGEYFWEVGPKVGRIRENSGILREYGVETQAVFGVAIKRRCSLFRVIKWTEVVARSNGRLDNDHRSINWAAQRLLSSSRPILK